jgi:hypothetical protein
MLYDASQAQKSEYKTRIFESIEKLDEDDQEEEIEMIQLSLE